MSDRKWWRGEAEREREMTSRRERDVIWCIFHKKAVRDERQPQRNHSETTKRNMCVGKYWLYTG